MGQDDPMLPGAAPGVPDRRARGAPFGLVAAGGLVAAVVLGLGAGALWGLSERPSAVAGPPPYAPGRSPGGVATPSSSGPGALPVTPGPSGPGPSVSSGFPPAPAQSSQTSRRWHVGSWRITNVDGRIGMQATVTNDAPRARGANLTMYLYVAGAPLARLDAQVPTLAARASTAVTFTSSDPWGPGTKTLLLVADRPPATP